MECGPGDFLQPPDGHLVLEKKMTKAVMNDGTSKTFGRMVDTFQKFRNKIGYRE